jgi:hypothetical protein
MITQNTITDHTYEQAVAARDHAARALYQAEPAVHDAHQTRVDQWIGAAHDRLHEAITWYEATDALVSYLRDHAIAA